jgi:hypothetical protein
MAFKKFDFQERIYFGTLPLSLLTMTFFFLSHDRCHGNHDNRYIVYIFLSISGFGHLTKSTYLVEFSYKVISTDRQKIKVSQPYFPEAPATLVHVEFLPYMDSSES